MGANALHIVSAPVRNAQVGATLKYQAVLSQPGATRWALEAAPDGAKIDQGGNVTWTPGDTQGGVSTFTISAENGGKTATQVFTVTTAHPVVETAAMVDPGDPNGTTISVDAPLSSVHGTALQIEPGALPAGTPVAVTISSVENAPLPGSARAAGVSASDLKPVELGPTGLAFTRPVKLQLPISAGLLSHSNLSVQTFDYGSGQWQKVKLLSVDRDAAVAVAEVQHFSTYVVTPDVKVIDLQANLGGAGTACASGLVVRAALVPGFSDIPASAVNGATDATPGTVADLLGAMPAGQALQVFTRVGARAAAATGAQDRWLLATATKLDGGLFQVSVTSDGASGALLNVPTPLNGADSELLAWLSGSRADIVFGALGPLDGGAVVTGDVSLYLVPASDASRPPPASANALGGEQVTFSSLQPLAGYDDDCDGAPNSWDPQPQGTAPPALVGVPAGPVHVSVGSPAVLKVTSPQPGLTFTWSASDPSVTLVSGLAGTVGTATPSSAGLFHVWVTGAAGGATARFTWDVIADPPEVAVANTPPWVAISASTNIVRAGDAVVLTAIGKDAEQSALTYAWATSDPTTLSAVIGGTVVFSAKQPGDYTITCVANDSLASSAPAVVTVSVVSPTANRAPGVPTVTPISAAMSHVPGAPVSLAITASAVDPDGDPLVYDFAPSPFTPPSFTLQRAGSAALFSTTQDGVYVFYVTATDPNGARSPWTPVKIMVLPQETMVVAIDADHDGYPAGFDCNDADPTVHPGAQEICGDGVDQDCDGRDRGDTECDHDGDRFSVAQGDCDDRNPAISPQMPERCDGIDNNCNGQIDEGFGVGADCLVGVGGCQIASHTVCSASLGGVVCGGVPRAPQPETCDGVDNDCDGQVDNLPGQSGGDIQNCGGCGIACPVSPSSVAACVNGGCVSTCAPGFVDVDRNPANGCECRRTNGGVEICDGLDNDCNGAIDEGVGALVYGGPAGTQGVGVCAAGLQICQGGKLVDARPALLPSPEICDGLDNDCNGKVDDGFDLMNDPRNCGGCGITCMLGQLCQSGKCAIGSGGGMPDAGGSSGTDGGAPPPPPKDGGGTSTGDGGMGGGGSFSVCPGAGGSMMCTDLGQDPANCGSCGTVCAAGQACIGGVCATGGTGCPAPGIFCADPAMPTKMFCANPLFDPANCGGCGKVCPAGVGCQMGTCTGMGGTTTCPPTAPMPCPMAAGGTYCTDPKSDAANCGGCGITCPSGVACQNGMCGGGLGCPATAPNGCMNATGMQYCTNLSSDPANCGGCGVICPTGVACQNGMCGGGTTTCPPDRPKMCPSPQGPICTDLISDPSNCGNCGIVCPAGVACQNGMCGGGSSVTCGGPTPNGCFGPGGEMCTNLLNDAGNCGRCGVACPAGAMCVGGICGGTGGTGCPPSIPVACAAAAGGMYCADPTVDPANCGACGHACPSGVACQMGVCGGGGTTMCPPTLPNACPNATGGSYCTNLSSDAGNCGTCGHACPAGTVCSAAMCVTGSPTCAAPQGLCPAPDGVTSFCADLMSDPANCGACGKVCPAGVACQMGVCGGTGGTTCPPTAPMPCPMGAGGMYCADPKSDPANCGGCGITCPSGVACQNGMCGGGTGCPATAPNGCMNATGMQYCTNLASDPANCGGCGLACPAGVACQNGMCGGGSTTCPPDKPKMCPSPQGPICTDMISDPSNCGNCGITCPAGVACQNGMCGGGSSMTCGGPTPNGCFGPGGEMCTNLLNDAGNCGRCGVACPAGAMCVGGICGGTGGTGCPPSIPVGCAAAAGGMYCADPTTDPANCGACGHACPAGVACQMGVCGGGGTTMCAPPMPNACPNPAGGAFCTNLSSDAGNCGGCGHACPAGIVCQNGVCGGGPITCAAPAQSCMDPASGKVYCADTQHDPGNCGACGKVCPGSAICTAGACQGGGGSSPGLAACLGPTGAPMCTSLLSDPSNCGACGTVCPAGQGCFSGQCGTAPTCPPNLQTCADAASGKTYCTNLLYDSANCGGCGMACPAGNACQNATCVPVMTPDGGATGTDGGMSTTCPAPMIPCADPTMGMYCADVTKDPANCGGCRITCAATQVCVQGKCG